MTWYDYIQKNLKINVRKVVGYRINTQISRAFLQTNNKKSEGEMKESTPFTTATKKNKIPRNKPI